MVKIVGTLSNLLKSKSPYPKVLIHKYIDQAVEHKVRSSSYYFQLYKNELKKTASTKATPVVKLKPKTASQKIAQFQSLKSPRLSYVRSSPVYFKLYKRELRHQELHGDICVGIDYIIGGKIVKPTMKKSRKEVMLKNVMNHGSLVCEYCNQPLTVDKVTFDHFHPKCQGGQDQKGENLKIACYPCNQFKAGFNPNTQPKIYNLFLELVREKNYSHLEFILRTHGDDFLYLLTNRKQFLKDHQLLPLIQLTFKVYSKDKLKNLFKNDKRFKETIQLAKQMVLNKQLSRQFA